MKMQFAVASLVVGATAGGLLAACASHEDFEPTIRTRCMRDGKSRQHEYRVESAG